MKLFFYSEKSEYNRLIDYNRFFLKENETCFRGKIIHFWSIITDYNGFFRGVIYKILILVKIISFPI